MEGYNHEAIEKKWQDEWAKQKLYETKDAVSGKDNEYILVEFPYPSGNLHVGHWYAFAVTDIYARYRRMLGKNTLFPIGFDAFGLPAENAAIKNKLNPRVWTEENMAHMRGQIKSMGAMFDWSREVVTCHPEYYRWTEWLFGKLFEAGLVYRAETAVNWCPSCKTGLANEQVVGGTCERCGSTVEQKMMPQWMLRITKYADRLIDDLSALPWPEPIKESQRQWIGRSEGANITFPIAHSKETIEIFTTRADTLFGVTYVVLAPEHNSISRMKEQISNWEEVQSYIDETRQKTNLERQERTEKTGVELKGVTAIHPGTNEALPVWIADYVLGSVGTGAVMAVPAHDERDAAFAKKYDLPIRVVIAEGTTTDSGTFSGLSSDVAKEKITEAFGRKATTYRLRDWGVSRQRYWGCPIPLVFCATCAKSDTGENPGWRVSSEFPVMLPDIDDYLPTGDGKSPLAKVDSFVKTICPHCGGEAERETDTLDTFVDSSWYFLRYTDPRNEKEFASKEHIETWMPVDFYSGGAEHTTMHLLYSRFFQKALFDCGLVTASEPYKERMNRGLIMGPDGQKMSKSRGNVIDPDDVVRRLGADTVRMYLAFIGPYNEVGAYPWNPDSIVGVRRFLERVVRISEKLQDEEIPEIVRVLHGAIKGVTESLATRKMNTGVASLMGFLNEAEKKGITRNQWEIFLQLLAPYAPHLGEELWYKLGNTTSIHTASWPVFDPEKLQTNEVIIAVQVNGKTRGTLTVPIDISEDALYTAAGGLPTVIRHTENKTIVRKVHIKGKLVNFVVS